MSFFLNHGGLYISITCHPLSAFKPRWHGDTVEQGFSTLKLITRHWSPVICHLSPAFKPGWHGGIVTQGNTEERLHFITPCSTVSLCHRGSKSTLKFPECTNA